jgi:hypothetical protein
MVAAVQSRALTADITPTYTRQLFACSCQNELDCQVHVPSPGSCDLLNHSGWKFISMFMGMKSVRIPSLIMLSILTNMNRS